MDDRQIQLIAAAELLRTCVLAQKAGWDRVVEGAVPVLHRPAQVAATGSAPPPVETSDPSDESPFDVPATPPAMSLPSLAIGAHLGSVARLLQGAAGRTGLVLARTWRPAAAVAIVALVGLARAAWPAWSTAVKGQLAASGPRLSMFDRALVQPDASAAATPSDKPVVSGRRLGHLQIQSNPSGAQVMLDGKDRGVTPLLLHDIATGAHTVVLRSDAGTVQRSVTVGADKTTQVNEAIFSGWVHLSSSLELELSEAGRGLRIDDSNQVLLPPGPHELRFENKRLAFVDTRKVEVRPGDTTSIEVEPPPSKLTVLATTPAEVLVDGTLVGGTPLADYPIQVGTREIVVRNADGIERRSTLTVTVDPLKLEIDFNQ